MKLIWQFDPADVELIQSFVARYQDSEFVKERRQKNLAPVKPAVTPSIVWQEMIACLLTTQQRSGPGSPVSRFIKTDPFLLRYDVCQQQSNLTQFATETLQGFKGIRWPERIAYFINQNYALLEDGLWGTIMAELTGLQNSDDAMTERRVAHLLDNQLKGFGPKQSRNLLQGLGLTRYEIPLDSRAMKKLNEFGFPVKLSPGWLSDSNSYEFVLDGIQQLCQICEITPCILDAAIFTSFDSEPVETTPLS